jgi:type I restriction enzyme M protein
MELFATTHKQVYRNIHNFLAGRFVGATRERALLDEVIKCLFCKVYLLNEKIETKKIKEQLELSILYRDTFKHLKEMLVDVFEQKEEIHLDPSSISFFDSEISKIDLKNAKRDPFGDLYEVFIGTGVREEEGQFFTPKNGIDLLVSIIAPKPDEKIIDPACGAGGFLTSVIQFLNGDAIPYEKLKGQLYGVDKDSYLAKLAKVHVALLTLSSGYTFCGDSLAWKDKNNKPLEIKDGDFDVVLTNPPFGKKIISASREVQKTYDLGYSWKLDKKSKRYIRSNTLQKSVPPQVLFVEKCIKLLKENGRLGIVLPESLLTSGSYSYVVQYIHDTCNFISVMGMPEDFFKTSGKGGTHTKACLVVLQKRDKKIAKRTDDIIFMAEAKWCGHDSRGREIEFDDLPKIAENFKLYKSNKLIEKTLNGYTVSRNELNGNIISPRYYNPEILTLMSKLKNTHDVVSMGKLLLDGVIEVKTGDEVGKLAYGTGNIPFVRTSDISSWEVKLDPKHGVSDEIFDQYKSKQNVKPHDILMVKDGTYLIGTCAILTEYDTRILYQSHLYKIRVLKPEIISPFLLLAILSSKPVSEQIKSKRFTQDIIDSLGNRIYEILLPIPKDKSVKDNITDTVKKVIFDRIEARELARKACLDVVEI